MLSLRAALSVSLLVASANAAGAAVFFFQPTPSPGLTPSSVHGTFEGLASGNAEGTLAIKTDSGTKLYFVEGAGLTIDGGGISCFRAPVGTATPNPNYCTTWPSYMRTGSTKLTVYYWTDSSSAESVSVTNQLVTDAYGSAIRASRKRTEPR